MRDDRVPGGKGILEGDRVKLLGNVHRLGRGEFGLDELEWRRLTSAVGEVGVVLSDETGHGEYFDVRFPSYQARAISQMHLEKVGKKR